MTPLSGPILTAAEMQAAEAEAMARGDTVESLMERAGAAVAAAVQRFGGDRPVLVLCGPGNNGGDGYVAARLLAAQGVRVHVAALGEPGTEAARAARQGWKGAVETLDSVRPASVLVDALFGTGLSRPLSEDVSLAVGRLRDAAHFTIAVDVPSGVGSDSGAYLGAAPANFTLALGALKPAHLLYPAAALCGAVMVADIGVPVSGTVWPLARPALRAPSADSHKYRRGLVGIASGAMPGAAGLAAMAAQRCAGYVLLAGHAQTGLPHSVVRRDWQGILADSRVGALLVGPGLGRDDAARRILDQALASAFPLVLDADALVLLRLEDLARLRARAAPSILTPHEGEFAALFDAASGSKILRARAAAAQSGAFVVHKGADTVIAAPDGETRIASGAPGWLASAGTGDVLAGIVAGLLSGGMGPFEAACAGVWLHGEAARLAGPALIADDLPTHIPAALGTSLS